VAACLAPWLSAGRFWWTRRLLGALPTGRQTAARRSYGAIIAALANAVRPPSLRRPPRGPEHADQKPRRGPLRVVPCDSTQTYSSLKLTINFVFFWSRVPTIISHFFSTPRGESGEIARLQRFDLHTSERTRF